MYIIYILSYINNSLYNVAIDFQSFLFGKEKKKCLKQVVNEIIHRDSTFGIFIYVSTSRSNVALMTISLTT